MPAPQRRRWFSLSLRTLLVAITLLSVVFGWFLHHRRVKLEERQILTSRYASVGGVEFRDEVLGWQLPEKPVDWICGLGGESTAEERDAWRWLRFLSTPQLDSVRFAHDTAPLPPDFCQTAARARLVQIILRRLSPDELGSCLSGSTEHFHYYQGEAEYCASLPWLGRGTNLRKLLIDLSLGPAAVEQVFALPRLEDAALTTSPRALSSVRRPGRPLRLTCLQLDLRSEPPRADKPEYAWLNDCPRLEELHVWGCIDADLLTAVGKQCPGVQRLRLYWSATTSPDHALNRDALQVLADWPNLCDLELHYLPGDAPSIERLGDCSRLKRLTIEGETFEPSPEDLRPLLRLTGLDRLTFADCPIGDAHLSVLAEFARRDRLQLSRTSLTARGEQQLERLRTSP